MGLLKIPQPFPLPTISNDNSLVINKHDIEWCRFKVTVITVMLTTTYC
jgi:hypothetical protein